MRARQKKKGVALERLNVFCDDPFVLESLTQLDSTTLLGRCVPAFIAPYRDVVYAPGAWILNGAAILRSRPPDHSAISQASPAGHLAPREQINEM